MSTEPTPLSEPAVYFADASDIPQFTNSRPNWVHPRFSYGIPVPTAQAGADSSRRRGAPCLMR